MMLVINPVAGKGEMMRHLTEVTGIFMDAGYRVSFYPTRGRGDATEYVKAYGREYDMICCSGGDGTINETISGMIAAGLDIPIGYMPSGSTNDFAEFHGISCDTVKTAKRSFPARSTALTSADWAISFHKRRRLRRIHMAAVHNAAAP